MKATDLIGRDFTASEPNTKYVGDITYLPVSGAKPLYLATVIDLCSRRLAGWAIADHMRAELVVDALAAAERTRGSLKGAIMHTDHGSPARTQSVVATPASGVKSRCSLRASAGVFQARVLRGLLLSARATASSSLASHRDRSVPFGKYWRRSPFVFSLVPRCQGLCGSAK
ncbi:hypothetical protein EAO76_39860 [Streptomyces sp. sk2.1]|nr:hypothetical protein EAO76_39860 [Streptomyces sp. sk2.1]